MNSSKSLFVVWGIAGLLASHMPSLHAEEAADGSLHIVSISIEEMKSLAAGAEKGKPTVRQRARGKGKERLRGELYKERDKDIRQSFGLGEDAALGGAGAFKIQILSPEQVEKDPIKRQVRAQAQAEGRDIVFVRVTTVVRLFGGGLIPIDWSVGAVSPQIGLRLGGLIEIVETKAIPRERAGAWEHVKQRIFLWPLSAERLKKVLKVGESIKITGRLEEGAAAGIGAGYDLGSFTYFDLGAKVGASVGKGKEQWVSLHINKTSEDSVRVLVEKGSGEIVRAMARARVGIDVYDDSLIPRVTEGDQDLSFGGRVSSKRGNSLIADGFEKLLSAELSASLSRGKHDMDAEGWGEVSLSDPESARALDALFRFDPEPLRGLSPEETFSSLLESGRLNASVRDVTHDARLQLRLSKLSATKSAGTRFYEIMWRLDDGEEEHYLVGVAQSRFRGEVTDTQRSVEAVLWHDIKRGRTQAAVKLGPQKRRFTTTKKVIDEVHATLKALGVPYEAEIDHPSNPIDFLGFGNYGRSVEEGSFWLSPEGTENIGDADQQRLILAYLEADWLYEQEEGGIAPPLWAAEAETSEDMGSVLKFLKYSLEQVRLARKNSGSIQIKMNAGPLRVLRRGYGKVAPGRSLRADA
ncbi:MAG: hypothetical protein V3S11_03240, partial [Elusimicrobiota bacterium]